MTESLANDNRDLPGGEALYRKLIAESKPLRLQRALERVAREREILANAAEARNAEREGAS